MEDLKKEVKEYGRKLDKVSAEVSKGIIGQGEVLNAVLKCMACNGHVLLESVPGLAKTMLVRLLTMTIKGAKFQRIQFTPDLLPTDITGMSIYEEGRGFHTQKGPIFANLVLGDEINRASPKVQSGMLQAMEERQVTIGRDTYDLPVPFIVLATQNPLEQQGVYPLSVAQVDRFLFKVFVDYPEENDELVIIDKNMETVRMEDFGIDEVWDSQEITNLQEVVKRIYISDEVKEYIVNLIDATRNPDSYGLECSKFIEYGASPRASIFLGLAGKATALMDGRTFVVPEDVVSIAHSVLRHRIILNYEGSARGIKTDDIVGEILNSVPVL